MTLRLCFSTSPTFGDDALIDEFLIMGGEEEIDEGEEYSALFAVSEDVDGSALGGRRDLRSWGENVSMMQFISGRERKEIGSIQRGAGW